MCWGCGVCDLVIKVRGGVFAIESSDRVMVRVIVLECVCLVIELMSLGVMWGGCLIDVYSFYSRPIFVNCGLI